MRFGVREICDVVFKARNDMYVGGKKYKKGQPVLYIDTAKTSSLETSAESTYAKGGQGNPTLITWESEKKVTFTVEDALLSPTSLAMLTGGLKSMVNGASDTPINVHNTVDVVLGEGGKVSITADDLGLGEGETKEIVISEDAPVFGMVLDNAGAGMLSCEGKADGSVSGNQTVNASTPAKLVFADASTMAGHTIRVDFYSLEKGHATEMTIDAKNFAGNFYVEASTLFREQSTGKDMPAELVFPNVKLQSNFTFNMAATGDPATTKFTMDAMPAYTKFDKKHKVFAAIQIIGGEVEKASQAL